MKGLIAHVDTTRKTMEEVRAVPTPERTNTWGVIGHGQVIDTIKDVSNSLNIDIHRWEFSTDKYGNKMFGAAHIEETEGHNLAGVIAFKNSIDKTHAFAVTGGTSAGICDNLAIWGSFVTVQKHYTSKLDETILSELIHKAIAELLPKIEAFKSWHRNLEKYSLNRQDKEAITLRTLEKKLIPSSRIYQFIDLFFNKKNEENKLTYEDTLYGFHGSLTQIFRHFALVHISSRHAELIQLVQEAQKELEEEGNIINVSYPTTPSIPCKEEVKHELLT